jgi:hypothetical protein
VETNWQQNDNFPPNLKNLPIVYLENETIGSQVYLLRIQHTLLKRNNDIIKKVLNIMKPNYIMVEQYKKLNKKIIILVIYYVIFLRLILL